jgi:site-specific recombinase XerD
MSGGDPNRFTPPMAVTAIERTKRVDQAPSDTGRLAQSSGLPPIGASPLQVRLWFDAAFDHEIPAGDGTLERAREIADVLARRAKAENTRRAYRAGVSAWCSWCAQHGLAPLPARPADLAAFLAAQCYPPPPARPPSTNTLRLRIASVNYLHYLAGLPSPTTTAQVTETVAGLNKLARQAGGGPQYKLAAKIGILRQIVAPIEEDLPGLRDRALLLIGFAGAFRRSEIARIAIADIEETEHGVRIVLPFSKGDREGEGVQVGVPFGTSALCPVRALKRWCDAARISAGPVFRRIWTLPRPPNAPSNWIPTYVVGHAAIDPRTVARIVQTRGAVAGFDASALGGHSLKRGAMDTAKDRRVHPAQLKQLGRHRSYATLAAYTLHRRWRSRLGQCVKRCVVARSPGQDRRQKNCRVPTAATVRRPLCGALRRGFTCSTTTIFKTNGSGPGNSAFGISGNQDFEQTRFEGAVVI